MTKPYRQYMDFLLEYYYTKYYWFCTLGDEWTPTYMGRVYGDDSIIKAVAFRVNSGSISSITYRGEKLSERQKKLLQSRSVQAKSITHEAADDGLRFLTRYHKVDKLSYLHKTRYNNWTSFCEERI